MVSEYLLGESTRPAAELEDGLGGLEGGLRDQSTDGSTLIERLPILFRP
jgi:hypothetical protein